MKSKTEKQKVKKMLEYRARGYSLGAVGGIYHLSRERVRQLINKYRNEPGFKYLYKKIEKTWAFLKR